MFASSANTQVLHAFNIVLDRRHISWLLCKCCRPSLYPAIPLEVFLVAFSYYSPLYLMRQDHHAIGYNQARLCLLVVTDNARGGGGGLPNETEGDARQKF